MQESNDQQIYLTTQVYGVSNEPVASYVERGEVDQEFRKGLGLSKHVVVYGASKQGKTALMHKNLRKEDYVKVECSPNTTPVDIYKSILRQLEVEFEQSKVSLGGPHSNLGKAEQHSSGTTSTEIRYTKVDYNLALSQDISEILRKFNFDKRIVLENFHYLTPETQAQLAFDLRVFEDQDIRFIILGIWRERNRLPQFNGDLLDRLIEIPVEPWTYFDFKKVVQEGAEMLNVDFTDIMEDLIRSSFDSIGVLQELCKETCMAAGVRQTNPTTIKLTKEHLKKAVTKKLDDYSSRHIRSLETFIEQHQKEDVPLYIPYYFIRILLGLRFEDITKGINKRFMQDRIKEIHHSADDVKPSDLNMFLHTIVERQIANKILPPLFDYDRSTRNLKVIDSTFYFFLRNYDRVELVDELDKPDGLYYR